MLDAFDIFEVVLKFVNTQAMPLNPILRPSGSVLDVVLLDAAVPDELSWSEEVEQQGLLSSSAWTDGCVLLLS